MWMLCTDVDQLDGAVTTEMLARICTIGLLNQLGASRVEQLVHDGSCAHNE